MSSSYVSGQRMKIAVTGCSGSVARAIVIYAINQGHDVLGIDVADRPPIEDPSFCFIKTDLTDYAAVVEALRTCHALIHAAALPSPGKIEDAVIHNTNVTCSYNALRAAAEVGIERVTQVSSINAIGSVYTPYYRKYHYLPLDEKHPYEPADPYALSKMICEVQAESLVRTFPKLRVASIRPHACLAERPSKASSDADAAKYGRESDHFTRGNVNDLWGWCLMESIAEACLLGLTSEGWSGAEAFYTVAPTTKIAEEEGERAPSSLQLAREHHAQAKLKEDYFEGEHGRTRGFFDCSKAECLLGWKHP